MGRWLAIICLVLTGLCALSTMACAESHPEREFQECRDCPTMVAVPAGKFTMGSPAGESGRFDSEGPQHVVSIRAFALGKDEVTVDEFRNFLIDTGYQPSACDAMHGDSWKSPGHGIVYSPGDNMEPPTWPATCLNWHDTQAYIDWLNAKVKNLPSARHSRGGPYRLPSEAEWEYAARGGTTTARWWGAAVGRARANCDGCGSQWDDKLLAPVGSFGANPFGLDDMLGNVWQWVADCWHDSYVGAPSDGRPWMDTDCRQRVMRGGSWSNVPAFVRSAARGHGDADGLDFDYSSYVGFRVARNLP